MLEVVSAKTKKKRKEKLFMVKRYWWCQKGRCDFKYGGLEDGREVAG